MRTLYYSATARAGIYFSSNKELVIKIESIIILVPPLLNPPPPPPKKRAKQKAAMGHGFKIACGPYVSSERERERESEIINGFVLVDIQISSLVACFWVTCVTLPCIFQGLLCGRTNRFDLIELDLYNGWIIFLQGLQGVPR